MKIWQGQLNECITAIDSGCITSSDCGEIIASTFSGRVVSFAVNNDDVTAQQSVIPSVMQGPQPLVEEARKAVPLPVSNPNEESAPQREVLQAKMQESEYEISRLKYLIGSRRDELAALTGNNSQKPGSLRAVSSEFTVRDTFTLDESAAIVLNIQTDTALHSIALQCDVDLELLDDSNSTAILSKNVPSPLNKSTRLLAVFRCVDETNCITIRARSVEGQNGTLNVFIMPKVEPRTVQQKSYVIRPLSLHHRVVEGSFDPDSLPLSQLRIQGPFTAKDAHAWIYKCLPEVPEMLQGEEGRLSYRNVFQSSVLLCRYKRGEAEFESDNLSALAILKDFITSEATSRKIAVRILSDPKHESVARTLTLLHDKILYQCKLVERMKQLEALREIELQETDTSFLSDEYKEVLASASSIEKECKSQPQRMEYLRNFGCETACRSSCFPW